MLIDRRPFQYDKTNVFFLIFIQAFINTYELNSNGHFERKNDIKIIGRRTKLVMYVKLINSFSCKNE